MVPLVLLLPPTSELPQLADTRDGDSNRCAAAAKALVDLNVQGPGLLTNGQEDLCASDLPNSTTGIRNAAVRTLSLDPAPYMPLFNSITIHHAGSRTQRHQATWFVSSTTNSTLDR